MKYINVPISAAKEIGRKYSKEQVIIVCWDKKHGLTHVTTWGTNAEHCLQAGIGGQLVKKALGWPDGAIFDEQMKKWLAGKLKKLKMKLG
jgi:hypothetical protein